MKVSILALIACALMGTGTAAVSDCPVCTDSSTTGSGGVVTVPDGLFGNAYVSVNASMTQFNGDCWSPVTDPNDPRYGICLEAFPCTPQIVIDWFGAPSGTTLRCGGEVCGVSLPGVMTSAGLIVNAFIAQGCGQSPCTFTATFDVRKGATSYGVITISGQLSCSKCNDYGIIVSPPQ